MAELTGIEEIDVQLTNWMKWDKNEKSTAEIKALCDQKNVNELKSRLCTRMEFGTAGLRARMGAGNSMMNDLTIIQTTQGLLQYALSTFPDLKERGIVVGYDARHNSRRFAELLATIFLNKGVKVYLYSAICPTPFVPFGILYYKCCCGVMVTASHNPKEDNGYKVYWDNGSQIIPPNDKGIAQSILENLEPYADSWNTSVIDGNPLCYDPMADVMKHYYEAAKSVCHYPSQNAASKLKITYSAMHGVGWHFCEETFKHFNLPPFIPVAEQVEPDPDFPTVKFPNPEEGKSALNLSIKTADENNSTLILANDPDADRLAVAEKQKDGSWKILKGNEIGALLGWWLLRCFKEKNPDKINKNVYMLSSTVSSQILGSIANKEGISFEDTLTGFKWMGNRTHDLLKEGKTVLFAFEEAIGFMCGTHVLDKDGVTAIGVVAEMAVYLETQGKTITDKLNEIYSEYGYHCSNNSYYICHNKPDIDAMFHNLRNFGGPNQYPKTCGPFPIKTIRDLTTGFDNNYPDNKARLPTSKSSHMITFYFENGVVSTLRTSGTEPKIKYYTEYCADPSKSQNPSEIEAELAELVKHIIEHFYEPEKNNFQARAE